MEAIWGILIELLGSWVLLIVLLYNFQNIRYIHKLCRHKINKHSIKEVAIFTRMLGLQPGDRRLYSNGYLDSIYYC